MPHDASTRRALPTTKRAVGPPPLWSAVRPLKQTVRHALRGVSVESQVKNWLISMCDKAHSTNYLLLWAVPMCQLTMQASRWIIQVRAVPNSSARELLLSQDIQPVVPESAPIRSCLASVVNSEDVYLCLPKTPKDLSAQKLYFFPNSFPSMLISLAALLVNLRSLFRSRLDLQLENLAVRHQINVLHRSTRKRAKLTTGDRLIWVCLSRGWRDWRSTLVLVKPETVVAWHRKGFRLFWTWKVRHGQPGRPVVTRETRDLIRKMCRENPGWGAPRIHGELLKLGIDISARRVSASTWCATAIHRLRLGARFWRTTSRSSSPSISSPSLLSVSRFSTCFWYWHMIVVAFFTSM